MSVVFGEQVVLKLCNARDNGGNTLLHLAVCKSLIELISFILSKTPGAHKILNQEGYNPLHLAVQMDSIDMVKCISQQEHFDVDVCIRNKETALHIAAQLGYSKILGELIKQGGDLSARDEDGHTPLHDCLQQVYFESMGTEEKCGKFINVWNAVVEKAADWWCLKHGGEGPAHGSKEFLEMQCKAVYYLRSCIKNQDGLSVLQFAADRGLITCVQNMLSTKDVFVIQEQTKTEENEEQSKNKENEEHTKNKDNKEQSKTEENNKTTTSWHEIDVTNLCPEYFVEKDVLYSKEELEKLEKLGKQTNTQEEEETKGTISFLEALAEIEPPNKAGEILESIPMMKLTQLEWRVTLVIHLLWMVLHFTLMIWATVEVTKSDNNPTKWHLSSTVLGIIILMYAAIITTSHFFISINRKRANRKEAKQSVKSSINRYKKDDKSLLDKILSFPLWVFSKITILLELMFTGFVIAVFIPNIFNIDVNDHI